MSVVSIITSRFNPPKPTTHRFDGLVILAVAVSGGIGLEAAKKLATLGPSTLIITARDESKCKSTEEAIYQHLSTISPKIEPPPKIIVIPFDQADVANVPKFIADLRKHVSHLDHAVLNAGVVQTQHKPSPSGYELTLQVNSISASYLGLSLLPLLLASPLTTKPRLEERPHLTFVSSGQAWMANLNADDMSPILTADMPLEALSRTENFPAGTFGGQSQYGRSKLTLEYAMRHIARLPSLDDESSQPKVVVLSTCPGMCKSDLARNYTVNFLLKGAITVMMNLIARSAEQGANIYVTSLSQGKAARGEMWKDDAVLLEKAKENIHGEKGKAFGEKVLKEMKDEWLKMDSEYGDGEVRRLLGV